MEAVRVQPKAPDERFEAGELVQRIEEYLAEYPAAAVLEDGGSSSRCGDRGMLDLLTLDRSGRLTVKADEDLHLPMQALDYWIRVRALNLNRQVGTSGRVVSAFERMGYSPDAEVSALPPRLLLAAPALRIHPANQPVLR